jgi:hypothetical protein
MGLFINTGFHRHQQHVGWPENGHVVALVGAGRINLPWEVRLLGAYP